MRSISLDPQTLLAAYAQGVFPMADRGGTIGWYTADPRGIFPLETFHVPRTLRQFIRRNPFEVRIDTAFERVMRGCAAREDGTWISERLIAAYVALHRLGFAHSVECWRGGKLAGGLYGVSLGAAFFGESMFHVETNASKVALVKLVERLRDRGYELLDTQAVTAHLARFGAIEIPGEEYEERLKRALGRKCEFG